MLCALAPFKLGGARLKKFNEMQQYVDIYLLLNYSTCFGRPSRPSSGVHKTVVAASGTDHAIWEGSFFKRDQIRTEFTHKRTNFLFLLCMETDKTGGDFTIIRTLKPVTLTRA